MEVGPDQWRTWTPLFRLLFTAHRTLYQLHQLVQSVQRGLGAEANLAGGREIRPGGPHLWREVKFGTMFLNENLTKVNIAFLSVQ